MVKHCLRITIFALAIGTMVSGTSFRPLAKFQLRKAQKYDRGISSKTRFAVDVGDNAQPEEVEDPMPNTVDEQVAPVSQLLASFFPEGGVVAKVEKGGQTCAITYQGKLWLRLPLNSTNSGKDVLFYEAGVAKPQYLPSMRSTPWVDEKSNKLLVEVSSLAELLMASTRDSDEASIIIKTPNWWCQKLGIKRKGAPQLAMLADFGVSPAVGDTVYGFARARSKCYLQVYSLNRAVNAPFEMFTKFNGKFEQRISEVSSKPAMVPLEPNKLLPFEEQFTNFFDRRVASYAILVTDRDDPDPLTSIRNGTFKGKWMATGVENEIDPNSPLEYGSAVAETSGSVVDFIKTLPEQQRMDEATFAALNGLRPNEGTIKGVKYIYLNFKPLDPNVDFGKGSDRYRVVGPYVIKSKEAQELDTIGVLADRWGVSRDDLLEANDLSSERRYDVSMNVGEIITQITSLTKQDTNPATIPKPELKLVAGTAVVNSPTKLLAGPSEDKFPVEGGEIKKGSTVKLLYKKVSDGYYNVEFNGVSGWILASKIKPNEEPIVIKSVKDVPLPLRNVLTRGLQVANAKPQVPYKLGKSSLSSGIDCSNFVSELFRKETGNRLPPPVNEQKNQGTLVHCNNFATKNWLDSKFKFDDTKTNWELLLPGDRFIIVRPPTAKRPISNHTGIYLGRRFPWNGKIIEFAMMHSKGHKGPTVDSLQIYKKIYNYSLRDKIVPIRRG